MKQEYSCPDFARLIAQLEQTKSNHPVETFNIGEYTCYITKNKYGAWLAYVDVTDFNELHVSEYDIFDEVLPFHCGCTFAQWTSKLNDMPFESERFLIGCDWNHGISGNLYSAVTSMTIDEMMGVERVSIEDVKHNLEEVIEMLPELRLKMTIRGEAL